MASPRAGASRARLDVPVCRCAVADIKCNLNAAQRCQDVHPSRKHAPSTAYAGEGGLRARSWAIQQSASGYRIKTCLAQWAGMRSQKHPSIRRPRRRAADALESTRLGELGCAASPWPMLAGRYASPAQTDLRADSAPLAQGLTFGRTPAKDETPFFAHSRTLRNECEWPPRVGHVAGHWTR